MNNKHRHFLARLLAWVLMIACLPFGMAAPAEAASKAAKNKAAHEQYAKTLQSLYRRYGYVSYQYADITGDGVDEVMLEYHPENTGSGYMVWICTMKKGAQKTLLKDGEYGLSKVMRYPKSKAIVLYCAGHGGEEYIYYKWKSGKYSRVASRARMAKAGGAWENGPWSYYNGKGKLIKKAKFKKSIASLTKGKKKTWKRSKWTDLY